MTQTADAQIQRLVALVAWMSQRDSSRPVRTRDAARALGMDEKVLLADLQVLLDLTDSYKPWLGSLSVSLVANGFTLNSRGAFRRPMSLSRDEALTLILGLAGVPGGRALAARLGGPLETLPETGEVERVWAIGPAPGESVAAVLAMARRARDERRKLEIQYCGSSGEASRRVVEVHQVVQSGKAWYLIAWCERAGAPRHFRAERVLEARELDEGFTPRPELRRVRVVRDLLAANETPVATVAFSPVIARWIRERFPGGEEASDGRYLVRFPVADPRWLVREVLQYGAEAEILAPEGLRDFMRRSVS